MSSPEISNICSNRSMSRQIPLFASALNPTVLVGDRGDVTYIPEFLDRATADGHNKGAEAAAAALIQIRAARWLGAV